MNSDGFIYIIAVLVLFNILSFLLTNNGQEIVKKAIYINIFAAFILLVFGHYIPFLFIFFLNIFIFIILSISGFQESDIDSFQEPIVDIPLLFLILIIFGVVVIGIFENIDYLKTKNFSSSRLNLMKIVNDYQDIMAAFLGVFLTCLVTLGMDTRYKDK